MRISSTQQSAISKGHARSLAIAIQYPLLAVVALLPACATNDSVPGAFDAPLKVVQPEEPARAPARPPVKSVQPSAPIRAPAKAPAKIVESRAFLEYLIPSGAVDRAGWASDIYSALGAMEIPPTAENFCAVIAITEQESSFRADPSVPGLSEIAWKEIEKQRERAGVPKLMMNTALQMSSSNGKTYSQRLDAARTERDLSDVFEDFIGRVPMGKIFFADRNPVRTGGPMQVSVTFAEKHAASRKYPYPLSGSIRNEVFTRRGGIYFGVAHLLDYPASYDSRIYRFADFNAGHYASRNAAFQNAVALASGTALDLDGDLLRYDHGKPLPQSGATELAVRALAPRLAMSPAEIRRDLERGTAAEFERTQLYTRVFALADKGSAKPLPRAMLPRIVLQSPKFTRKLTTAWFAKRVDDRHKRCLARAAEAG